VRTEGRRRLASNFNLSGRDGQALYGSALHGVRRGRTGGVVTDLGLTQRVFWKALTSGYAEADCLLTAIG